MTIRQTSGNGKKKWGNTDPTLKYYFKDLKECPPLSIEDEHLYAKQYKAGSATAGSLLYHSNLRIIISMAKKFYHWGKAAGLELSDLIQEGNTGLLESVEKFDPDRGFRLYSYASWNVKNRIMRRIMESYGPRRIPAKEHNRFGELRKKIIALRKNWGCEPSIEEMVTATGWEERDVRKILADFEIGLSIEAMEDFYGEGYVGELGYYADVDATMTQTILSDVMDATLNFDERMVLRYRFGMNGDRPMKLEEIGSMFGHTKEWARLAQNRGLKKLKEPRVKAILSDLVR